MLRLRSLKTHCTLIFKNVNACLTQLQSNYVTYDEWKKLSKAQLKDTPVESLIWNTPEVKTLFLLLLLETIVELYGGHMEN
jgi:hypothetical protein